MDQRMVARRVFALSSIAPLPFSSLASTSLSDSIDARAALNMEGVVAILTADELPVFQADKDPYGAMVVEDVATPLGVLRPRCLMVSPGRAGPIRDRANYVCGGTETWNCRRRRPRIRSSR